jgi:meso-butanediol dehydrogenase/(S,S)-butanediol dehydrogenase/diacetyl reductase
LDISSASACRAAVERCVAQFGRLDVLINIAGSHRMRRTETMTDDHWADDLAVNLGGPFYLCRAALPHLLAGRQYRQRRVDSRRRRAGVLGRLLHGQAWTDRAHLCPRRRVHGDRLRVNAVCPGGMLTPQLEHFTAPDDANFDLIMRTAAPRGMIAPLDVANVIAFLASDAAAAIHGAVYRVDNGKGAG